MARPIKHAEPMRTVSLRMPAALVVALDAVAKDQKMDRSALTCALVSRGLDDTAGVKVGISRLARLTKIKASPSTEACLHPVNRRIGDGCALCGANVKKG